MKVSYFFRHNSPVFHSIEEQFYTMQAELPKTLHFSNNYAKYPSNGLFRRLLIGFNFIGNQSEINHITGDIHFIAAFLKKRNTILTIHDIGSALNKKGFKQSILKYFWFTMPCKRVKYVTVISEFTKKQLLETVKINAKKIIVIPDCVSPEIQFITQNFNRKKPRILQIGTKTNKNLPNLINALAGIPCQLEIIGRLSDFQKNSLLESQIDYTNTYNLDYKEIIKKYKQADIISFVSDYEGFGVPILEAQATGRVVITSNISPMKEVAGAGAILVEPNNSKALQQKIIQIIKDSEFRNSVIEKGKNNVTKYSAKAIAQNYFKLYKRIISENQ